MADHATPSVLAAGAGTALSMAVIIAGVPLFIGFMLVGMAGAFVGHARWTLARERDKPDAEVLPLRQHVCMILRALLMAEFVTMILFLIWTEQGWSWTWGLVVGAISSVFAADAIEIMWVSISAWLKRIFTRA